MSPSKLYIHSISFLSFLLSYVQGVLLGVFKKDKTYIEKMDRERKEEN